MTHVRLVVDPRQCHMENVYVDELQVAPLVFHECKRFPYDGEAEEMGEREGRERKGEGERKHWGVVVKAVAHGTVS